MIVPWESNKPPPFFSPVGLRISPVLYLVKGLSSSKRNHHLYIYTHIACGLLQFAFRSSCDHFVPPRKKTKGVKRGMLFSKSPYKNTPGGEEIEDARVKDCLALGARSYPTFFVSGVVHEGFKLREGHVTLHGVHSSGYKWDLSCICKFLMGSAWRRF